MIRFSKNPIVMRYTVYFPAVPEEDSFAEEICLELEMQGNYIYGTSRIGDALIKFLNGESFLGLSLGDSMLPDFEAFINTQKPTAVQEETLRRFLDVVLVSRDIYEAVSLVDELQLRADGCFEFAVHDTPDETTVPVTKFSSTNAYSIFLYECFEMFSRGHRLRKCSHCGKYYFPVTERESKFCSDRCRSQSFESKDHYQAMYRKTNRARNKYANYHKVDPDVQERYRNWKYRANAALIDLRDGRITETQFEEILAENIKPAPEI